MEAAAFFGRFGRPLPEAAAEAQRERMARVRRKTHTSVSQEPG